MKKAARSQWSICSMFCLGRLFHFLLSSIATKRDMTEHNKSGTVKFLENVLGVLSSSGGSNGPMASATRSSAGYRSNTW